tara:strand:- start:1046 stop:1255 length:210 start_codon:yes stop_codon:yes gene_type:complete
MSICIHGLEPNVTGRMETYEMHKEDCRDMGIAPLPFKVFCDQVWRGDWEQALISAETMAVNVYNQSKAT